eukprot:Hpha_TRINITY_DN10271_c0_g1::TRINITY_DN10271_c0_g1_i1::g.34925::m.34925
MTWVIDVSAKVYADEPSYVSAQEEWELACRAAVLRSRPAPPPPAHPRDTASSPSPAEPVVPKVKQEKGKRKFTKGGERADEVVEFPEGSELKCQGNIEPEATDVAEVTRVKDAARAVGLTSASFRWVPREYYMNPLDFRVRALEAPGREYLCKSIVVENTQCTRDDCAERLNSKFYLVCFQYVTKFDSSTMMKIMRDRNPGIGKRKFNYRLVENLEQIAGFPKNATAPVGLRRTDIPVVLSTGAAALPIMWLGGGHVDVKMRVDTRQFQAALSPLVLDVCVPLTDEEILAVGKGE